MSPPLILCIEDEAPLRDDIAFELRDAGFRVITAADAAEALRRLEGRQPDLILCDIVHAGHGRQGAAGTSAQDAS